MASVKRFVAIGLDTFASLLSRIGWKDQVREDLLEEVCITARHITATWQPHFASTGVPEHLTRRVALHMAGCEFSRLGATDFARMQAPHPTLHTVNNSRLFGSFRSATVRKYLRAFFGAMTFTATRFPCSCT